MGEEQQKSGHRGECGQLMKEKEAGHHTEPGLQAESGKQPPNRSGKKTTYEG